MYTYVHMNDIEHLERYSDISMGEAFSITSFGNRDYWIMRPTMRTVIFPIMVTIHIAFVKHVFHYASRVINVHVVRIKHVCNIQFFI